MARILASCALIGFMTAANAGNWEKAWCLSGSPFKYVENSSGPHGGPFFGNMDKDGLFWAINITYIDYGIHISFRPNERYKEAIKSAVSLYIKEKIGVKFDSGDGKVLSKSFTDKGRYFSIENEIDDFGYFTFLISILPEVQKTKLGYYDVPITDYGATDILAAILKQMMIYEGKSFEENVFEYSIMESKNSRHFVIRDNNPVKVDIFAEILDLIYKMQVKSAYCSNLQCWQKGPCSQH